MPESRDALEKVQTLFEKVIQLAPGDRTTFLKGENIAKETQAWVLELVQRFESDSTLIPQKDKAMIRQILSGDRNFDVVGATLGSYRILEKIGQGGMGAVYLAERADGAFVKKVAIKLVRCDWRSDLRLSQFQQERQILAQLQHPMIARLLDGGTAADGLAYLVMDYVEGEPVTDFCDRLRLPLRERIALVIKLCGAVQYAHQNLVVHRDLKPNNILVQDNGNPILIDFGIAKPLQQGQPPNDGSLNQAFWFSPSYASPEQIQAQPITTRSDIYALGILLHQLLTGILPYELPKTSIETMRAFIEKHQPQRPSQLILAQLSENPHSQAWQNIANQRKTEPKALARRMAGDLDAILLRAMAIAPQDRYSTIDQLADDLRHYLAGFPVKARQVSMAVRWGKWVTRNPLASGLATLMLVLVLGFAIYTQLQYRRILLERDHAKLAFGLLQNFLKVEAPMSADTDPITAMDMIHFKYRNGLDFQTNHQEVALAGHLAIGDIFLTYGMLDIAEKEILQAAAICDAHLSKRDPRRGRTQHLLGSLAYARSHFGEAVDHLREAIHIFETKNQIEDATDAQLTLAKALRGKGERAAAVPVLEDVLHKRQKLLGMEGGAIASVQLELGYTYLLLSEFECAEWLLRQARENQIKDYPHLTSFTAKVNLELGNCLRRRGQPGEAIPFLTDAIVIGRRLYGHSHQFLSVALGALGSVEKDLGHLENAEQFALEALDIKRMILGEDHQSLAGNYHNLGMVNLNLQRSEQAAKYFQMAVQHNVETDGPKINRAFHHFRLGAVLVNSGQWAAGEHQLCEAIELFLQHSSQPQRRISQAEIYLAQCLMARGNPETAWVLIRGALPSLRPGDSEEQALASQLLQNLAAHDAFPSDVLAPVFVQLDRLIAKRKL